MHAVTIRASVKTGTAEDGTEQPIKVTVTGAEAFDFSFVQTVAQEALDSYFGSYGHDYVAVLSPGAWHEAKGNRNSFDLRVVKL